VFKQWLPVALQLY